MTLLETVDEGLRVGVTEFGGTLEHDGGFGQRHGGATIRESGISGTQVRGCAGDVKGVGVIRTRIEIRALRVIQKRVGIMEKRLADLDGTRRVLRRSFFRTARARAQKRAGK